jgi:antitoxin (DNA-binding transcriptional repressor) of toxin-antitoxin stability system
MTITEFESRLGEYIHRAGLGHEFTLLDGGEPVARRSGPDDSVC